MSTNQGETCAVAQLRETSCINEEKSSTIHAHKIDAYESRRCHINESDKQSHGELSESFQADSFADTYISKAMKMPEAKAAADKCKLGNNPKVETNKKLSRRHKNEGKTVHVAMLMDFCHLTKSGSDKKIPEVQTAPRIAW